MKVSMSEDSEIKKVVCPLCKKIAVPNGHKYPINYMEDGKTSIIDMQRFDCKNTECGIIFFINATHDY